MDRHANVPESKVRRGRAKRQPVAAFYAFVMP
jgi:hypothetical protein